MFGYKGLWGQLEHNLAKQAEFVENRLIVLAGPVLAADDPSRDFGSGIEVTIPVQFWKVIVVVEKAAGKKKKLRAYGFVLDQAAAIKVFGWEGRFRAGKFSEQQRSLSDIANLSRVKFDPNLYKADPMAGLAPTESRRRSLTTLADIRLR